MYEIKKVYSDNPYVDELVYYTMKLGLGTVLKLKNLADSYETLEILKEAELYLNCRDGTAVLRAFTYFPMEVLCPIVDPVTGEPLYPNLGLPTATAQEIVDDPSKVFELLTKDQQDTLTDLMEPWYIDQYVEKNRYYRELYGLPDLALIDKADPSHPYNYYVPDSWVEGYAVDTSIPIHEMDDGVIAILDSLGILDKIYEQDPQNRGYVKHLGKNRIDIYLARKAQQFEPLFVPTSKSNEIREMYIEKLNNNRVYTLGAVYSEAYRYNSDYYDNVMAIFIVLISMIDIISRVQEFITRKEIFDIRSVEYLFQSYGVEFFPEIPLRYQIRMVKNIHTLLKYKSTATCMVDICSLFGFKNVKVFKYYLLRDRNIDHTTGEYVFAEDEEGNEDYDKEYTLKFIKLPLEDNVEEYIRDPSNQVDYDELTDGDKTWDGGLDHEMVKEEVLKQSFNLIRTKYISIDTVYDIAKVSAELTYFYNMLYDTYEVEDLLQVRLPFIDGSTTFKISDVFSMLTALSYYYYNKKDILMDDTEKVLYVNGFNFHADLAELASYLRKLSPKYEYPELEALLNKFQIADEQIPSFEQMMAMFVNNLNVRDALIEGMKSANNHRVFTVFKHIYYALCTVKLNMAHFKDPETGEFWRDIDGDATYTEYFKHTAPSLYYQLMQITTFDDEDERTQYISTLIDNICQCLENYIDLEEFDSILYGLPAVSAEFIKQYVSKVINFFKSYKVDFLGMNTIYYLDDYNDGVISIHDYGWLHRYFVKDQQICIIDLIQRMKVNMTKEESLGIIDKVKLDIFTWAYKYYEEYIKIDDTVWAKIVKLIKYTLLPIEELISGEHIEMTLYDYNEIMEFVSGIQAKMTKEDPVIVKDKCWINRVREFTPDMAGNILVGTEDDFTSSGLNVIDEITGTENGVVTESAAKIYIDSEADKLADNIDIAWHTSLDE